METKQEMVEVLENFHAFAKYHEELEKYYMMFLDKERYGMYVVIWKDDMWSVYGFGEEYEDEECKVEFIELVEFLWQHKESVERGLMILN